MFEAQVIEYFVSYALNMVVDCLINVIALIRFNTFNIVAVISEGDVGPQTQRGSNYANTHLHTSKPTISLKSRVRELSNGV